MATMTAPATVAQASCLNFAVVGEVRSGSGVVQGTIHHARQAVCHENLFYDLAPTAKENEEVRRSCHESYFGPCEEPVKEPEWMADGITNPYRYLSEQIWDANHKEEKAVGLRLTYSQIRRHELAELMEDRWRDGDFCVVHVTRNPIACFVSLRQAIQSRVWRVAAGTPQETYCPLAVRVDPEELVQFVRHHEAVKGKIRAACKDTLEVSYKSLVTDTEAAMERVFEFLELPQQEIPCPPTRRLRNRKLRDRISNYTMLRLDLPKVIVRDYLDGADTY